MAKSHACSGTRPPSPFTFAEFLETKHDEACRLAADHAGPDNSAG